MDLKTQSNDRTVQQPNGPATGEHPFGIIVPAEKQREKWRALNGSQGFDTKKFQEGYGGPDSYAGKKPQRNCGKNEDNHQFKYFSKAAKLHKSSLDRFMNYKKSKA